MNKKIVLAGLFSSLLLGSVASAAIPNNDKFYDPGLSLNRTMEMLERERVAQQIQEDKARNKEKLSADNQGMDVSQAPVATLTLQKIETDPSEVLTTEEISAITKDYIARPVTVKELYEMVNKINDLYASKGYATCGAVLEPQNIEQGVLKVTIIEGKNGQVEIYGNKSTKSKYITKYLHVGEGEIPNVNVLNKEMLLFNATNDAQLRIMLKPGAKVGTTDYVLQVYEPKLHNFTVFMDNGGSYYTGEFRTGMFYNCKSLSGERDALSLGTIFSEGTKAVSTNYSRNIGNKGEKLYLGYSTNAVKQVREDRDIYSKGHANVINLGYNRPVIVTEKMRTEVNAELSHQNSVSDTIYGNMRGNAVDDTLNDLTLSFSMINYGKSNVIYQKHSLIAGRVKQAPEMTSSESRSYELLKSSGLYQKVYEHGQSFTARGDLQLGRRNQPTQRSFSLGGMNSVRGYRENMLSADSGYNIGLEYATYLNDKKNMQFFTFMDYGHLSGYARTSSEHDRELASLGIGLKANIGKKVYVNWSAARTLKRSFNMDKDVSHYRMNFFISGQF